MKILLVDDALDMRLVMKRTLTLLGHDVTLAEDGEAAWELLQTNVFQVVITDWVMPRLDGPGLCRRIRESVFANYLYIIMLTGLSGKPNLIAGMDAGADDFTTKPIERDEIEVMLRAANRVIELERKLELKNQHLAEVNASLQKTQNEVQRDLRHAAVLQKGLLPEQKQLGALDFAWLYRPASFIGGETLNYFPIGEDISLFYTVDVSGHGISSALLSMYLSNLLTSCNGAGYAKLLENDASIGAELSNLVVAFNEHLQDVLDFSEHYFTMILGVINTRRHRLHFVQSGHPKPFLVNTKAAEVVELDCTGFPVGLIPNVSGCDMDLFFRKNAFGFCALISVLVPVLTRCESTFETISIIFSGRLSGESAN